MGATMGRRVRGSVKFDPYYKVQWYDRVICSWREVQKSYPSMNEATAAFIGGRQCRVVEITMAGRFPIPPW